MLESFAIALMTLGIVLYGQARAAAREIRRNRRHGPSHVIVPEGRG